MTDENLHDKDWLLTVLKEATARVEAWPDWPKETPILYHDFPLFFSSMGYAVTARPPMEEPKETPSTAPDYTDYADGPYDGARKETPSVCTREGDHLCCINGPCNGYPKDLGPNVIKPKDTPRVNPNDLTNAVEQVLFRRHLEHNLVGCTLDTAREIANLVLEMLKERP